MDWRAIVVSVGAVPPLVAMIKRSHRSYEVRHSTPICMYKGQLDPGLEVEASRWLLRLLCGSSPGFNVG